MIFAESKHRPFSCLILLMVAGLMTGCPKPPPSSIHAVSLGSAIAQIDQSSPTQPVPSFGPIKISSARNAYTSFIVRLDCRQMPPHPMLWMVPFQMQGKKPVELEVTAYQMLSAPVDLDDAAYVRQTGQSGNQMSVPRVLLPLPMTGDRRFGHQIDLAAAHDPARPTQAGIHAESAPILLWVDIHTPDQIPSGEYFSQAMLVDAKNTGQPIGSLPIHLTVDNVTLPDEPHLHFAAPLDWDALVAIYPDLFQGMMPRLMNRSDASRRAVLDRINAYLQLAHQNKADFYVPRLQPIVKWPLGKRPETDWTDFDSVVSPWLTGSAFTDHRPVAFWPLPAPDSLAGFDLDSQIQYWQEAASHFDLCHWLDRSPVVLSPEVPGQINEAESLLLCAQARQLLAAHPRVMAMLPLHDDQTELASTGNPNAINPASTARLITAAQGLVYPSPIRDWPAAALPPRHWIDSAARDGSCDITGVASEQGIRTLASLAYSRDASLILCPNSLPGPDNHITRADQLIWCYPGEAFGVDHPLATVQLKWIRQAEQDYEYLYLAAQHKDQAAALKMTQLLSRPVQLQPGQPNDPIYNLLAGNTDPRASEEARQLLIDRLNSTRSPTSIETDSVELQTMRWFTARQRPTLAVTGVQWNWDLDPRPDHEVLDNNVTETGNWIDATVSVDLYNPAEEMPGGNMLDWTAVNSGWQQKPAMVQIPSLAQYQVRQVTTRARFNLNKINDESRQPLELSFYDGFTGQTVPCKFSLPIAVSQRRTRPLNLDGQLDDWFPADAIQLDQPLIRMLDRPALQSGQLSFGDSPASVYTSWSEDNFYLAFRLGGVAGTDLRSTHNFVKYDHGRAWGEDLCEVLIQPIYIDNTVGPTLHVVCKPAAGTWIERQAPASSANITQPWQDFEASGIRYAAGIDTDKNLWRGEIAIPWSAIATPGRGRPSLLRFNFIQHQQSTAQSASWAGPLDQSRDGGLSGLLLLKEP
jgi:hypothetical protein